MQKLELMIAVFVCLSAGLCSYWIFNTSAYISKLIFNRSVCNVIRYDKFSLLMASYFADFCWALAFPLSVQLILWLDKKQIIRLMSCFLLGLFYELLQFFKVCSGTFDFGDLLVYFFATVCALCFIKMRGLYEKKETD